MGGEYLLTLNINHLKSVMGKGSSDLRASAALLPTVFFEQSEVIFCMPPETFQKSSTRVRGSGASFG
jgi:hypothetical protein